MLLTLGNVIWICAFSCMYLCYCSVVCLQCRQRAFKWATFILVTPLADSSGQGISCSQSCWTHWVSRSSGCLDWERRSDEETPTLRRKRQRRKSQEGCWGGTVRDAPWRRPQTQSPAVHGTASMYKTGLRPASTALLWCEHNSDVQVDRDGIQKRKRGKAGGRMRMEASSTYDYLSKTLSKLVSNRIPKAH